MKMYTKKISYFWMIMALIAMMFFGCSDNNSIVGPDTNKEKVDKIGADFYTMNIIIYNNGNTVENRTVTFYELENYYYGEFNIGSSDYDRMENIGIEYGIQWNSSVAGSCYWSINEIGWWKELSVKPNSKGNLQFKDKTFAGNGVYHYILAILEVN